MSDAAAVRDRVDAALAHFADAQATVLRELAPDLAPLADSARDYLLVGGKRLRPLFCYWAWRATRSDPGGTHDDGPVVTAAASLELVQACALAHDDVIDASDSRRGRPALHREWQHRHSAAGWEGDPGRFGVATSILLGDLFLSWSDAMLGGSGLPAEALGRVRPVWDLMRAELLAGQFLDVVEQARSESSVERALRIAGLKSGRYSVERPLLLGAAVAGADPTRTTALAEFGHDVGIAFQLRDDLLGVFGDPAVTGKPAGDDLREGKRTVLVALALDSADAAQRRVLLDGLGRDKLGADDVDRMRGVLTELGAVAEVERMIRHRSDRAVNALDDITLNDDGREQLLELAELAVQRRQ